MTRCTHSPLSLVSLAAVVLGLPSAASAAGELECLPRAPTQVWSDSGSGGRHDVSIWRSPAGEILGDLALPSYGNNGELCGFIDRAAEQGNPALRPARAFVWRYNDRKTGASRSVSIWEPVCDDGFVAMGVVAAPFHLNKNLKCPVDQPCTENQLFVEFDRFRCVRADLVRPIGGAPTFVWNDKKTGGAHDVSFWSRPAAAGQAGLGNLAFFWVHRSHATPAPTALTVAKHELKAGVVAMPQPVAAVDDQRYYNIRLKGSNAYVAVESAGLGEFYGLVTDAADPRAQFHLRNVGSKLEIINRSSGGAVFSGEKVGAAPVEDTVQVHLPTLVRGLNVPTRSREWSLVPAGERAFKIAGVAGERPVVWGVQPVVGSRLINLDQASAPANMSTFELFEVSRVNTAELRSGVFDPGIGSDRALRLGLAIGAALVSAATRGAGGGIINLAGLFFSKDPSAAIAAALERLYNQVQIDIGQEIAAKSLTESGNALLDATYALTVDYSNTLRDNISDPSRLVSIQNSAKDTARAFLAVRQRLTLERQGARIAAKPANALLIEGGLQIFANAAALHTAALQEAALIAAFDKVGSSDDELQTLDAEIEKWIAEYEAMYRAQLDWRKDSVSVRTNFVPGTKKVGFIRLPGPGLLEITLSEKPSLVSKTLNAGIRTDKNFTGSINPATPFENAIRARYRSELEFAYDRRYQPVKLAADLRALKAPTAALCAKIRVDGSPERQAYLESALAGRGAALADGVGELGTKSIGPKATPKSAAKPQRSRLKMVKQGNTITWEVERLPG